MAPIMKTVTNKTHRPLKVPLPHGKILHLNPGRSGQISDHAVDHPPLRHLLEAGEIGILEPLDTDRQSPGSEAAGHASTHGHPHKPVHKSGDR